MSGHLQQFSHRRQEAAGRDLEEGKGVALVCGTFHP